MLNSIYIAVCMFTNVLHLNIELISSQGTTKLETYACFETTFGALALSLAWENDIDLKISVHGIKL